MMICHRVHGHFQLPKRVLVANVKAAPLGSHTSHPLLPPWCQQSSKRATRTLTIAHDADGLLVPIEIGPDVGTALAASCAVVLALTTNHFRMSRQPIKMTSGLFRSASANEI